MGGRRACGRILRRLPGGLRLRPRPLHSGGATYPTAPASECSARSSVRYAAGRRTSSWSTSRASPLQAILDARRSLSAAACHRRLDLLLEGLAHVQDQGYLHRDRKPANIVIRAEDGEPVLVDFGAPRPAARERTHTRVPTPDYAPNRTPESCRGHGRHPFTSRILELSRAARIT